MCSYSKLSICPLGSFYSDISACPQFPLGDIHTGSADLDRAVVALDRAVMEIASALEAIASTEGPCQIRGRGKLDRVAEGIGHWE